jgi:N-acetylglucosamine malate deacetylase 2
VTPEPDSRSPGSRGLPVVGRLTVVCAHPDDESFGLGALISSFTGAGTHVALVCLTAGERSSLGAGQELAARRTEELACAARVLGIDRVELRDHPDGALGDVDLTRLVDDILDVVAGSQALLTYDEGGVTGHPDHRRATEAAVAVGQRLGIDVLGWTLAEDVAARLTSEFPIPFVGRTGSDIDLTVEVSREQQMAAIACHGSQLAGNPVPHRRIVLQGDVEHVRILHRGGDASRSDLPPHRSGRGHIGQQG